MKPLQNYHFIWLSVHKERTEDWLKERLSDGFHIHHKDGDHSNDAPENLILMDGVDHLRLHGMKLDKPRKNNYAKRSKNGARVETLKVGCEMYYAKKKAGITWRSLGGTKAMNAARSFAEKTDLPWPPQVQIWPH